MVNHLSRCLMAMSIFSLVSWAVGWQVVGYPLFATGITSIILADLTSGKRMDVFKRKAIITGCIATSSVGIVFAPRLSFVSVVPLAAVAVLFTDSIVARNPRSALVSDSNQTASESPLANLCVSLPSAVALLAVLALA